MTNRPHIYAAILFGISFLIAILLHISATEYQFSPTPESSTGTSGESESSGITLDKTAALLRVTGSTEPGNIEVRALLVNLLQPNDDPFLVFQIVLKTQTVDLKNLDPAKKAFVENSKGSTISTNIHWVPDPNRGYQQIMGFLVVPEPDTENRFIRKDVEWIKLVLRDIPKIKKREFIWEKIGAW